MIKSIQVGRRTYKNLKSAVNYSRETGYPVLLEVVDVLGNVRRVNMLEFYESAMKAIAKQS